jgi:UDP-glucose 4-epimerase
MKSGESLTIVGDGNQRRDFTHVSDVVNANILGATKEIDSEMYGQVFNVGTGNNYSVNQVSRMISNNTINMTPRPGESRVTLANNQKLRKTFGWEPTIKLEEWIAKNI